MRRLSRPLPHGGPPTLIFGGFQDEQVVEVSHPKHLLPPPGARRGTALVRPSAGPGSPAKARTSALARSSTCPDLQAVPTPRPGSASPLGGAGRLRLTPPASSPGAGRRRCGLPTKSASGRSANRETLVDSERRRLPLRVHMFGPLLGRAETVKFRELDSFLPSRVQMAPWTPQRVVTGCTKVTSALETGRTVIRQEMLLDLSTRCAFSTSRPSPRRRAASTGLPSPSARVRWTPSVGQVLS